MIQRIALLRQPHFIIALLILLINDHFIKIQYPSFLSGKLSDFAGLFIFPIFVYVVIGNILPKKHSALYLVILTGAIFALLQVDTVLEKIKTAIVFLNLPEPTLVADLSDLVTLSILPISFSVIRTHQKQLEIYGNNARNFSIFSFIILVISCASLLSTSYSGRFDLNPRKALASKESSAKVLFLFEQSLLENDVEIKRRKDWNGDKFLYNIEFDRSFYDTTISKDIIHGNFYGRIEFMVPASQDSIFLDRISLYIWGYRKLSKSVEEEIINNLIINPLMKKLQSDAFNQE